jgi:hypothetical protein
MGTKAPPKKSNNQTNAVIAQRFVVTVTRAEDIEPKNPATHVM